MKCIPEFHRRGQMEIIGLVVIVVLIALGLLFFVQFGIRNAAVAPSNMLTQEQIASSTLNAMLPVQHPGCSPGIDMRKLVQLCAAGRTVDCPSISPLPRTACDELTGALGSMLGESLGRWSKRYELTISAEGALKPAVHIGDTSGQGCTGDRRTSIQPLPADSGGGVASVVKLSVCS